MWIYYYFYVATLYDPAVLISDIPRPSLTGNMTAKQKKLHVKKELNTPLLVTTKNINRRLCNFGCTSRFEQTLYRGEDTKTEDPGHGAT